MTSPCAGTGGRARGAARADHAGRTQHSRPGRSRVRARAFPLNGYRAASGFARSRDRDRDTSEDAPAKTATRRQAQTRHYHVRGDGEYSVPCEKLHQPDRHPDARRRRPAGPGQRVDPALDAAVRDPRPARRRRARRAAPAHALAPPAQAAAAIATQAISAVALDAPKRRIGFSHGPEAECALEPLQASGTASGTR